MIKNRSKGFTLIELLVVIAIIGILSAVVLASLGTARSKGVDAAVKASMDSAKAQAELFASGSNSYSGACAALGTGTPPGLAAILAGAASPTGATVAAITPTVAGGGHIVTCHDSLSAWAADAPLASSTAALPHMWCVDSNGQAKDEGAVVLPASAYRCS